MKRLITLILCIGLMACSKESISNKNMNMNILAFGDSLTYGYGISPDKSYPNQLGELIGKEIINAGLNGDTARNGKIRLRQLVAEHNPDLVILGLGGNDMLRKNTSTLITDLEEMIVYLKTNNIQVVLLAMPNPSSFSPLGLSDAKFYKELADKYDIIIVEKTFSKHLSNNALKIDPIHLNEEGYKLVAIDVANKLKKEGLVEIVN